MDRDHEETERIPWAMLAEDLDPRRRWLLQAVGGTVVVAVVGVIAWVTLRGDSGTTVQLAAAPAPAASTTLAEEAQLDPAADTTAAPTPALYSEADLMAVVPEMTAAPPMAAIARAEQFVVDFFGLHDDPGLPAGLPAPDVGDGYAWVEWSEAAGIRETAGGVDVLVEFRILTGGPEVGYTRLPVRAVWVPIDVDGEGGVAVADLPTPAEPLTAPTAPAPAMDVAELPDEVAAEATAAVAPFGTAAGIVGGSRTDEGWRVVVMASDDSGVRWPLAVMVSEP